MASIAGIIEAAIRAAGIPVIVVRITDVTDRATWVAICDPSATPAQQAQAAAIIASIQVDAAALHTQDQKDVKAFIDAMPLVEQAIDLTILDQVNLIRSKLPIPLGAITVAQWIAAVKARVDTL